MKNFIAFFLLFAVIIECHAQEFVIPERTNVQKHQRTIYIAHSGFITGIAFAKQSGAKISDYAAAVGDMFKTGWNKEAGFKGFAAGTLFNWENLRAEQEPVMEIMEQNENSVVFKVKMNYRGLFNSGSLYNVTLEEYNQFFEGVHQRIAAHLGATFRMEVLPEDWLKMTIARSNP